MRKVFCFAMTWLVWAMSPAARGDDCVNENAAIPFTTPTSDFTLNPDGTATHHTTGLIWDRCLWGQSGEACSGTGALSQWKLALTAIKTLNGQSYKGHNDWRMPNVKELGSIMEYRCWDPAVNTTVFPNFPTETGSSAYIWTSTPASGNNPFTFSLYDGTRKPEEGVLSPQLVILVRGGHGISAFDLQFPSWMLRISKAGNGSVVATFALQPPVVFDDGFEASD